MPENQPSIRRFLNWKTAVAAVAVLVVVVLLLILGKTLLGNKTQQTLLSSMAQGMSIQGWLGEYYDNVDLSGEPTLVRDDAEINFDWGNSAPTASLPMDNFSVRWTRSLDLEADTYDLFVRSDDGVRVWVDGNLIIDEWHLSAGDTHTATLALDAGTHLFKVEYYEQTGWAQVQFGYAPAAAKLYPDWKGEYWANLEMAGTPVLVQNEGQIDFDWGLGSAAAGLPVDNWSARWTRQLTLEAASYRFYIVVDDGARLWVDDRLILESWQDGASRELTVDYLWDGKSHQVRAEYYEHGGQAQMRLWWEKLGVPTATPAPTSAPTPGPTTLPTPDPRYPDWKGMYWANMELRGDPKLVQNESKIDFDWGIGSAAAGLPADRFSARWERWHDFAPGTYVFSAQADNGIRFYLDGELLIDEWTSNGKIIYTVKRQLSGPHWLQVEYYDNAGPALVRFDWKKE
jgi:hypothetical protein